MSIFICKGAVSLDIGRFGPDISVFVKILSRAECYRINVFRIRVLDINLAFILVDNFKPDRNQKTVELGQI